MKNTGILSHAFDHFFADSTPCQVFVSCDDDATSCPVHGLFYW